MNYSDRIVCFLDILGFKHHIARTQSREGVDVPEELDRLARAFANVRELLDVDNPSERPDKEVTQFSDSVVISFAADSESGVFYALLDILWMQLRLANGGLLCRGAIARGPLIHTPSLLFGPAMVAAYELESRAAIYPRVILDKSIIVAGCEAHARHNSLKDEAESILGLLARDADGMFYVDYICKGQGEFDDPDWGYVEYLGNLAKIAIAGASLPDRPVAIKYEWLKAKLSPYIAMCKRNSRANIQDSDLVAAYEALPEL
jgi:hypothetical protein